MKFKDGDKGNKMRPEFSGMSTIQLILDGHRTATSRDMSKKYNQYQIEIGDIIQFYSDKQKVFVRITKKPYPISNISKEDWSILECWDTSVYEKLNKNYYQFQYELIP